MFIAYLYFFPVKKVFKYVEISKFFLKVLIHCLQINVCSAYLTRCSTHFELFWSKANPFNKKCTSLNI